MRKYRDALKYELMLVLKDSLNRTVYKHIPTLQYVHTRLNFLYVLLINNLV